MKYADDAGLSLSLPRASAREPLIVASWVGLLGVMDPAVECPTTLARYKFGYRYSLDAAPFLMLLTACGMLGRIAVLKHPASNVEAMGKINLLQAGADHRFPSSVNWAGMAWMFTHFNGFGWMGMWYRLVISRSVAP